MSRHPQNISPSWTAGDQPALTLYGGTRLSLSKDGAHAKDKDGRMYLRQYNGTRVSWKLAPPAPVSSEETK